MKADRYYNKQMGIDTGFLEINQAKFKFAFYFERKGQAPVFVNNCERFLSASIIKIPLLLTWVVLERLGEVKASEICDLDAEPQVHGAGFAYRMLARRLPYHDVLLMMIATSDNLCTNLVIQRMGIERIQQVFREELGLQRTQLQRKLMDYKARAQGLDNWVDAREAIHFFELIDGLTPVEKAWVEPMLLANTDDILLKRNIPRDQLDFYHKTGSITGVLHDWGYSRDCRIFLFTNEVKDEPAAFELFGKAGEYLIKE